MMKKKNWKCIAMPLRFGTLFSIGCLMAAASAARAADWFTTYMNTPRGLECYFDFDGGGPGGSGREMYCNISRKTLRPLQNARWVPGCRGGEALCFRGDEKYSVPDTGGEGRKNFTLLVHARKAPAGGGYLVLKKGAFGFPQYGEDGEVGAYLKLENGADFALKGASDDGSETTWTLVVDGTAAAIYRNGECVNRRNLPAPVSANAIPLLIGNSGGWSKKDFQGTLELLRLYDSALSAERIAAIHAQLRSRSVESDNTVALQLPLYMASRFVGDNVSYEKRPQALYCDGKGGGAVLPDYPELKTPAGLTFGAWIKPENTMPHKLEEQGYIASCSSGNHAGWMIGTYYDNGLAVSLTTDKGNFSASAAKVLKPNVWQHVAFAWDGCSLQLFVDGVAVGERVLTEGKFLPYDGPITLGKASDRDGMYYQGAIDEVRIFSVGLLDRKMSDAGKPVIAAAANSDPSPLKLPRMYQLGNSKNRVRPLVDFEDLTGWTVKTHTGIVTAELFRSEEDPLWGQYAGKLTFKAGDYFDAKLKTIDLLPPEPILIDHEFDRVEIWVSGEYWGKSKGVRLSANFVGADGEKLSVPLDSREYPFVFWSGWSTANRSLAVPVKAGSKFLGLTVKDFDAGKAETIFLDDFAVYKASEALPPGIEIPTWKELGAPTDSDGQMPRLQTGKTCKNSFVFDGRTATFTAAEGADSIIFRYRLQSGTLNDLEVSWNGGKVFIPAQNGGFRFAVGDQTIASDDPELKAVLVEAIPGERELKTRWQWSYRNRPLCRTELNLAVKNKTLVIDFMGGDGMVSRIDAGVTAGLQDPKLQTIPYYVIRGGAKNDPALLYDNGMLLSVIFDIYVTESSHFIGGSGPEKDGSVRVNGGAGYGVKSDRTRNPVRERMYLTLSSDIAEVLPHIANPKNPSMALSREGLWVTRMWYDTMPMYDYFDRAYEMLKLFHAYGLRNLMIRDHGTLYRMYSPKRRGGSCAPGGTSPEISTVLPDIGGDAKAAEYFRQARENLGYRMGMYTNYTLISPVTGYEFDREKITWDEDGQWRYGSGDMKMYKYAYMLDWQKRLNPVLKKKFNLNCTYPDQYTCRSPWEYTDFDARVPEAGKFSPALRVMAQCLNLERELFEIPLSEGIMQWTLAGFCDSYAQPGAQYDPWFPEFQLRQMHRLSNDCGIHLSDTAASAPEMVDRLLAGQLANGTIGHLYGCYGGPPLKAIPYHLLKSYYIMKQLQKFYAGVDIAEIGYPHQGKMLNGAEAIAAGIVGRNQLYLKYANGLEVWVNGNPEEKWTIEVAGRKIVLPAYGYYARSKDQVETYSIEADGRRVDYSYGPEYLFAGGNGQPYDFGTIRCAHAYAVFREDGAWRVIPTPFMGEEEIRISTAALPVSPGAMLEKLDVDAKVIAREPVRIEDGKVIIPIEKGVFGYRIK